MDKEFFKLKLGGYRLVGKPRMQWLILWRGEVLRNYKEIYCMEDKESRFLEENQGSTKNCSIHNYTLIQLTIKIKHLTRRFYNYCIK